MVDSLRCSLLALQRFRTDPQVEYTQIVSAVREWDRVHLWSLSRTLSLMLD